jgi:hypothetical protein
MRDDLKRRFESVCNEYVLEFTNLYDIQLYSDDIWVANDVGGIVCIGDRFFDFLDVIKYAVDNQLSDYDELMEWYEYTLWAHEFGQNIPNFKSWCNGCPRVDMGKRQELIDMKKQLDESIKNLKEKY